MIRKNKKTLAVCCGVFGLFTLYAVIGACAALFGVIVSQGFALLKSRLDEKHVRQVFLRQKYEALVCSVDEASASLLPRILNPEATVPVHVETVGKARSAYTLSLIYFPLLTPDVKDFMNVASYLESMLLDEASRRDRDKILKAAEQFGKARIKLDEAIRENADTYT